MYELSELGSEKTWVSIEIKDDYSRHGVTDILMRLPDEGAKRELSEIIGKIIAEEIKEEEDLDKPDTVSWGSFQAGL